MTRLFETLPKDVRIRLRGLAAVAENIDWPAYLARREGWHVANQQYHARQRLQGSIEMEALLGALDLHPPLDTETVREVLLAAVELYLHTDETNAEAHAVGGGIRIDASRCPLYERFTDPRWNGLTACGCFARVRGWHDALGLEVDEELVLNRKWGDPVCQMIVHIEAPLVALGA